MGPTRRIPHQFQLAVAAVAVGILLTFRGAVADEYYLRGGIGFDLPDRTAFTDVDCLSTTPAALYGCGTGPDGARRGSAGRFGTVPVVEFGLGHAAGAGRFEVMVEYRPHFAFKGQANFLAPGRRQETSVSLSSISGMVAGFVEFPDTGFPEGGSFVPFAGVGFGIAKTRIGNTTIMFPTTTTTAPGGSRTGLAWMATIGVARELNERMTLDLAWRYSDLGEVRTERGPGSVVWRDGSRDPRSLDLAPMKARFKSHGIRMSVRYAFE